MKAIILVGGLGTRLRSVVSDLPKPMAPIQGKPFLAYLLDYLKTQGITEVVLPVHFMREKIEDYFQSHYDGINIHYVYEEELLGTGGAMVNALSAMSTTEPVFVINGDTFVKCDYRAMYQQHLATKASLTMALRAVDNCERYGKVVTENTRITAFKEKGEQGAGLINAGVYLIHPALFSSFNLPTKFSFENDFVTKYLSVIAPHAFLANDYFIDIGIPEDYERAQAELVTRKQAMLSKLKLPLNLLPQLFRFGVIGVTAAFVQFVMVVYLVRLWSFAPLLANIIAFLFSFQISHWGHRRFTFSGTATPMHVSYRRLLALQITNLVANESLYYVLLSLHLPYTVALLLVLAILPIFTFVFSKWWVFR